MQIFKKKLLIIIFVLFLAFNSIEALDWSKDVKGGATLGTLPPIEVQSPTEALKESTGVDVNADSFEFIGDNFLAKGDVCIRKGELVLYSDMAIVNNNTKNIELAGNVKFCTLVKKREELEYWELEELQKNPYTKLKVVGTVLTPTGRQKLVTDIIREEMSWSGSRVAGNLKTGVFEFGDFVSKFGGWYALGNRGKREANGKITIENATVTPCESILEGHSTFSWATSSLVAYPPSGSSSPGSQQAQVTPAGQSVDNYHFLGYNNVLYIGAIPVLWLPIIYKPPKGDEGKWGITIGSNTDWGFFVLTTNSWKIYEGEDLSLATTNMIDYYARHGLALGNQTEMFTEDTQTELMVYGLIDGNANLNVPDDSRFGKLNSFRYGLELKNISNITDRLSFRGQIAKLSDLYFLYDYFDDIARRDPQPATYGNLNYQFDNASANLIIRPRLNNFFSVVEALPRLDLTAPRQELIDNVYFQSETNIGYYNMKWRDFKISRSQAGLGSDELSDYGTFRLDSVNFAYYPVNLDWINFIPRAGLRMTVYGGSSSAAVTSADLDSMIAADAPEGRSRLPFSNYNNDGGGKFRIIPEFGFQANTKISRSWGDVKNAYFDMDGIRHVFEPYVNYTYIAKPTVNRDYLYYFDDVDRIDEQNWLRVGMSNRLQTRRGDWGSSQVYTWASMENYVDFIFTDRGEYAGNGWKNLGDIGTKLTLQPYENLNFTMEVLVDGSRIEDFSNLLNSVDKASFSVDWDFAENWGITGTYYFGNLGYSQGQYSMGSMVSTIQAGSVFMRKFTNSSYLNLALDFELNERTAGVISMEYDFQQKLMPGLNFTIIRSLPCGLEFAVTLGFEKQNNTSGSGTQFKESISASIGFTPDSNYIIKPRENLLPEDIVRTPW